MADRDKKYFTEDWAGKRYGHLVIERYEDKAFVCRCDCGNEKRVKPSYLFNNKQTTCGLKCPIHLEKNTGKTYTRLYRIWSGMKGRCSNPNNTAYKRYGGRGITVCPEWADNFESFRSWSLEHGYQDDLTIDRIDGNKGYSPDNCRWATYKEQRQNEVSRYTYTDYVPYGKQYEVNGISKTLKEWAKESGISSTGLAYRIKQGMTMEEAISTPKLPGIKLSSHLGKV